MLKQTLQQKLLQKLSPQQIQLIKLLEVPTIQLEQRIKKELEENPVLEEGREENPDLLDIPDIDEEEATTEKRDISFEEIKDDNDIPAYRLNPRNQSRDETKVVEIPFSVGISFRESLSNQLGLRILDENQQALAHYILGNIDDDGYLRRDLESIVDDLAFSLNISTTAQELEEILMMIQEFDPPGVGARDLRECLLLQIDRSIREGRNGPDITNARLILADYFEEFTRKHYDKIQTRTNFTDDELKAAINEILRLNPKPGGGYSDANMQSYHQIVPDFILEDIDGTLELSLNSKNAPDLRINSLYANMLKAYNQERKNQIQNRNQKEAANFVRQKMESARWFMEAIKQRQHTLILTMNAIKEFQKDYFLSGGDETRLRPMILKDIAEKTELDISTISRVANSKYIQTNWGIFPLKYFFSEGLQTDSGEEVSTREIKMILQECIDNEDKSHPVTDEKLAQILKEKGYLIARRTVAKYREQLNIPVARLRKELL
ncbi:MAG: RNA polymerase factor sigma-54 [Bacteroidales bacterium]|jgi:RNA polymerase sigma-54 factor|nr:RNA polymerase factor sigma-54 [Bacteroidales bacterium]MDD2570619.1 RNA polymerase factor sigma-54 [Bacteroidales bacterium]MDD3384683.1 RNA polymerase factor sigma-54 [Bacteroidales bacterium]MDD3810764.1 RNA polymerase factor sigma-54 [Bacteroidales bacterium]MDD3871058.1 RNA polymerase factor sigma-54 [Bacteroidales bacterium]